MSPDNCTCMFLDTNPDMSFYMFPYMFGRIRNNMPYNSCLCNRNCSP